MELNSAILLLGTNIEPRRSHLGKAIELLGLDVGNVIKKSQIYESEPWGFQADLPFLNQAIVLDTKLNPLQLLDEILAIEYRMGRRRSGIGYTSREIDIDILYYNHEVISSAKLSVPHPGIPLRKFTLLPLIDVAQNMRHPVLGLSQKQLLEQCEDPGKVWVFEDDLNEE